MNKIFEIDNSTKLLVTILSFLLILIFIIVNGFRVLFLNDNNGKAHNSLLYIELVNTSFPLFKVSSKDIDELSEENVSIKTEILKLINIDVENPISILKKEITTLNLYNSTSNSKKSALNINSFNVTDEMLSKSNSKKSGQDSNLNNAINIKDPSLVKTLDESKPEILIYHTHTTESFEPNGIDNNDPNNNICNVGESLKNDLEKNYGISVIHDTTIHNTLYMKSYYRSAETVNMYLKKYGDFKLIIDMHRDAAYTKDGTTRNISGESVAKFMFVLTKKNPHFEKNAAVTNKLIQISDKLFPGLYRRPISGDPVYYYNFGSNYFNQQKSNNAVLVEIGANVNTQTEAMATTKYLSRIIAEYINGKK